MAKKRIDYEDDNSTFAQLMSKLAEHNWCQRHGELRHAATTAYKAEKLVAELTNESLERFDAEHPRQRRSIAKALGLAHGTINHRINQGVRAENVPSKAEAKREYHAAREELDRISRRDGHESDEYLQANQRVAEAEKNVSWWRR